MDDINLQSANHCVWCVPACDPCICVYAYRFPCLPAVPVNAWYPGKWGGNAAQSGLFVSTHTQSGYNQEILSPPHQ